MSDLDLARRAVACKGWRWLPGMRVVESRNGCDSLLGWHDDHGWNACAATGAWVRFQNADKLLPVLRDPATRGCLLQLVREAWGKQVYAVPICYHERITHWLAVVPDPATDECGWPDFYGADEVSALIAALEAAP